MEFFDSFLGQNGLKFKDSGSYLDGFLLVG